MGNLIYNLIIISISLILLFYLDREYAKKKRKIGKALFVVFRYENYLWVLSLVLLSLSVYDIFRISSMQFYDNVHMQTEYIKEIGLLFFILLASYILVQRTAIHQGGIKHISGVWRWDEVKSFSMKKEGPYQYEEFYNRLFKPKYELTFEVVKNKKTGELKTLIWKVPEKRKDKIHQIIATTVPEKELSKL